MEIPFPVRPGILAVEPADFFVDIVTNQFIIPLFTEVLVKKILVVTVALCVWSGIVFGQTQKLAYVDSETILKELKEAQEAKKEVDAAVKEWTDELEKMVKELEQNVQDYQKKESLYNPQKKEDEQKKLGEAQQKIRELQLKRQQDAAQLRDKKFQPIREKVLKSIEVVAKEEGFTFVFDKLNETILLYADVKYDLTYKVIDRLKRGPATKTTK
jgi:outer membrane protein